jgi:hypothetical protein
MSNQLIYPIATGRSGTVFLTALLKENANPQEALIFHERTGYPNFGVHTPDASHFTTYNHVGNTPLVSAFFTQKLDHDLKTAQPVHAEISHFLFKAGLIENLPLVHSKATVKLVALKRDPLKIAWSFVNRFNFFNYGFSWLFGLDPRYPNVIVPSKAFRQYGMFGSAVWYVQEIFSRMEYYRILIAETMPHVDFKYTALENIITKEGAASLLQYLGFSVTEDSVVIPEKQNETRQRFFGDKEYEVTKNVYERLWKSPEELGREFYKAGNRLGNPVHLTNRTARIITRSKSEDFKNK